MRCRTLYVTTAWAGLPPEARKQQPHAGSLFAVNVETPGLKAAEALCNMNRVLRAALAAGRSAFRDLVLPRQLQRKRRAPTPAVTLYGNRTAQALSRQRRAVEPESVPILARREAVTEQVRPVLVRNPDAVVDDRKSDRLVVASDA